MQPSAGRACRATADMVRDTDITGIYCASDERTQALACLNTALEERTIHRYFMPVELFPPAGLRPGVSRHPRPSRTAAQID
jgi:hypothetical protein